MNNKVSIIVPIYNVEHYLEKCVESLVNQTYENIEILLVDDCSTDNSGQIAKEMAKNDDRCYYIEREKNGGLSATRNTGIKNATGDYLAFVDSDDWIAKNYVESMLKLAVKGSYDIVVCDYIMVTEQDEKLANSLGHLNDTSNINEKIAYIRNHACTKLFRMDFWKREGLMFPENIKRGEDMAITIPLLTRTDKIGILNEGLYYYLQRNNSLSNNKVEKIDLGFYDATFDLMLQNKDDKHALEIEYHGILEMIYGKTMLMIKHKYSNKEIKAHLKEFDRRFPNWRKNRYINNTNLLKKVFIKMASMKLFFILRIMVGINERRK